MSKASRQKHRIWLIIAFIVVGYGASKYSPEQGSVHSTQQSNIEQIWQQHQSDVQVEVTGNILKLLRDDLKGDRHQKFIIELNSGHTVLISHNINVAPRINSLAFDDVVTIYGEYEWTEQGGVLHWTHHDPQQRHVDGWIKHQGQIYQ